MTTHKVRVSQDPTKELEVDDAELTDLERQGLLVNAKGEKVDRDGRAVKEDKAETAETRVTADKKEA